MIQQIKKLTDTILGKKSSIIFFVGFAIFNVCYFVANFFLYFLTTKYNGDEDYQATLYSVSDFSLEKFCYVKAQPYVFLSSFVDIFVRSPKYSTRVVSLIFAILLIIFFVKKIKALPSSSLERIYKISLFICAIFITNQIYMGTSDFLSYFLMVPAFLIILESIDSGKIQLTWKKCLMLGVLFGLSIASRPTAMILIVMFYASVFLIAGFRSVFCKENIIIFLSTVAVFALINILPIIQQHKIILDVKEVPKETGVDWFQRNYLMAKFWDANQIPRTQWVSTKDVIQFKKENPDFKFPKNQIDLLIKEPGLYFRQMVRMTFMAVYTSFRFMFLLFPILLLSFLNGKRFGFVNAINTGDPKETQKNKIIIIFHFLSILAFAFLAIKMFEFRWIIPIMILYAYYAIVYLSKFPERVRFIVYTLSFISGIALYSMFFLKEIL
ncbi:MAG: hypothetical protein QM710_12060 [Flavobacterium sp.]